MKYIEDLDGTCNLRNTDFRRGLYKHELFTYGHFNVGLGSLTIGGVLVKQQDDTYHLLYGISFCSPEDQFEKREGRWLASMHLTDLKSSHKRGSCWITPELAEKKPSLVLKYAAKYHLYTMKQPPVWCKFYLEDHKFNEVRFRNE